VGSSRIKADILLNMLSVSLCHFEKPF